MLEEVKKVLAGIRKDTEKVIRRLTENHLRCERYDVTTAPNGTVIGVTQPFGTEELQIPYSWMCSNAQVGDTVIVVWWNGLSNAQAWFMGDGWVSRLLSITSGGGGITVNGTLTANSLELSSPLPIASGGTGASVAYQAVANLQAFGLGQAKAAITSNSDLNTYTEMGVYGITDAVASTLSHSPATRGGRLIVAQSIGGTSGPGDTYQYVLQEYVTRYGETYRRYGQSESSTTVTWYAWFFYAGQPDSMRSALGIGSLISESKSAANNSSMVFSLSNNEKGAVICSGVQSAAKELIIFNSTSSGGISAVKLGSASGISVSTSANTLTINNTSGAYAYGLKISYIA